MEGSSPTGDKGSSRVGKEGSSPKSGKEAGFPVNRFLFDMAGQQIKEILGSSPYVLGGTGNFASMYGHRNVAESGTSSTWRELEAVYRLLMSFEECFSNRNLKWHTDSRNVVYVLQRKLFCPLFG